MMSSWAVETSRSTADWASSGSAIMVSHSSGVRTEGQAMVHVLALASIRGLIVRGPAARRDQTFVLARDWLGAPPPAMSREAALGELARRYLAGHAPAADRDLAQWAGTGLRDARLGLARCGAVQRADGLAELPASPQHAAAALPPPLLLGAFDPLLLGWASRDLIVGPHRRIVTRCDYSVYVASVALISAILAAGPRRMRGGSEFVNTVVIIRCSPRCIRVNGRCLASGLGMSKRPRAGRPAAGAK